MDSSQQTGGNVIILPATDAQTMTSLEIARLTEKRHDNVMRDIRNMLVELHGEGGVLRSEGTQANPQNGQSYPIFRLCKRETLILISGYDVVLRAKIIDRWAELEALERNAPFAAALNDPSTLRQLLLDNVEARLALQAKVEAQGQALAIAAPKVEALDRIAAASGSINITAAAKLLQVRPRGLFLWLQKNDWIFRSMRMNTWMGYQSKVTAGFMEHKVTGFNRADGSRKVIAQALVTNKGLARLAEILPADIRVA